MTRMRALLCVLGLVVACSSTTENQGTGGAAGSGSVGGGPGDASSGGTNPGGGGGPSGGGVAPTGGGSGGTTAGGGSGGLSTGGGGTSGGGGSGGTTGGTGGTSAGGGGAGTGGGTGGTGGTSGNPCDFFSWSGQQASYCPPAGVTCVSFTSSCDATQHSGFVLGSGACGSGKKFAGSFSCSPVTSVQVYDCTSAPKLLADCSISN